METSTLSLWAVTKAELRRQFALQWANPGESLSWILYVCLAFGAVVAVLGGMSEGAFGQAEQLSALVGWLAFQVAVYAMASLPSAVAEEAQTGTLEQICLTPVPLPLVLATRSGVSLLVAGARGLVGAAALGLAVGALPRAGGGLLLVFGLALPGAYGLGYLLAGLALVFKRVSALTSLVFSLMIFLTGAFVGLEKLAGVYGVTQFLLPLTWGISLMRALLSGEATLPSLWRSGALAGLGLHSALYLALGLLVFGWGHRVARRRGTVAHY